MKALVTTLALFVALAACAKAPDERDEPPTTQKSTNAGPWLASVGAAHANADGALTAEAREAALTSLQTLASGPAHGALSVQESAKVRRDLYAHAARVALDLERFEAASTLIQQGLALEGSDPFRTQLLLLDVETQRALRDTAAETAAVRAARNALALE
jgi:hypothetical protein